MLRIRLFGELEVELDGVLVEPPQSRRASSLLAWLALNPGLHPRARLAARFWPDVRDDTARASLRTTLWELRRTLGPASPLLLATREKVGLGADGELWVDARAFAELEAAGRLDEALALCRGELLANVDEEWVFEARDEHRERLATVLARLAAVAEERSDLDGAIRLTRDEIALDRLREEPHRELIRRLALRGERAAAFGEYKALRERLWRELGLTPSRETARLVESLRVVEPAEAAPPVPPEPEREPETVEPARREERKIVSVLFADLAGSTGAAERLDPEDVRRALSPYYARLRAELERHGAVVEKFIGDAVVAVFGAPSAHEDDPERAVRAALSIRDAVAELNREGRSFGLDVRVGVTTGEALVTLAGRSAEEGVAVGDVVNTAARVQAAAPLNAILVDEPTFRATQRAIEYRDAESVVAKGKAAPVRVWEAVGPREAFGGRRLERRAPLVARTRELDVLAGALARARQELETQLVTLVGVPGIGKSRLVLELLERAAAEPDGIEWRQGRSLPYGAAGTYSALAETVKADVPVEAVIEDEREAAWVAGHLRPLVGVVPEAEPGDDRRREAFAAWRRYFEALAEKRPLVLVFEDLHWADDGLLDFVEYLVEWTSGVPLLVVCTARPELLERRPAWGGGKRNATTLSLAPLTAAETEQLVGALLGQAALPPAAQEALLARAEGNPLYAEEYVRMFHERGNAEELPLPATIQGLIAARLDALPAAEKEVLADAAVVGRLFWSEIVAGIGARPPLEVEQLLHSLERKEFVRRERRSPGREERSYVFRHVLLRDVAYAQIPRSLRAEKHRSAAELVEASGAGGAGERTELLAHHYARALEYARAAGRPTPALAALARRALRAVGDRATALSSFPAAARYYQAALELVSDAPEEERLELLLALGEAQSRAGSAAAARETFEAVVTRARELDAAEPLARAALGLGGVGVTVARADERLVGLLEEALAALGAEDRALRARLLARLAVELYYATPAARRDALSGEAVELARASVDAGALLTALSARHVSLWDPDHLDERLELASEMLAVSEEAGDRERMLQARNWRFVDLVERGEIEAAKAELDLHERLADDLHLPAYEWYGPLWRAMLALLDGRFDESEGLAGDALALGRRAEERNAELFFAIHRFHLRLEQGRPEEAPEAFFRERAESSPAGAAWRAALTLLNATLEREDEARAELERSVGALSALPRDVNLLTALVELSEACALLGDSDRAPELYELLLPYADRNVAVGRAIYCFGSASRFLGALATTMGRYEEAERHFEAALQLNRKLGAVPALARTELWYARMLLARGGPGDGERGASLRAGGLADAERLGMRPTG